MAQDDILAFQPSSYEQDNTSVEALLKKAFHSGGDDKTSIRDMVEALGYASLLPTLMVVAMAVVSPLSGIPLFSSICGVLIALTSVELLIRRKHLWLPGFLMRRQVSSRKLANAYRWAEGPARWLDRVSRPRLQFLVRRPLVWIAQIACLLAGAVMPFLELVPFTSSILGLAVFLMGFGMLVRDGLFALLGLLVIAALVGAVTLVVV
ncbi:exopolysaccharide biosynthesis protein [Paracoccus sp. 11-3]|uniref:Exopolysaccharide biosynthesis protein n=2 Tax=Paracoccus amoyensis TaxID=2760093 RepID=A0A926JDR1_9RHOB|nr:exopolysaccharide biosynthesis protein [Paracoccus amoyensis]